MAIIDKQKIYGKVGDLVFRRHGNKVVVSRCPGPRRDKPTEAMLAVQRKFTEATSYAKAVQHDPVLREIYKDSESTNVYNRAMKDALNSPEITRIDTAAYMGKPGDSICIRAQDDFKVAKLLISIHSPSGKQIEEGNASALENGIDWIYTATCLNQQLPGCLIRAAAIDLPGNKGIGELRL